MSDEGILERLMSEFVDDLNDGREPRLFDYLLDHPNEVDEFLPLMNFVGWFKAATMEVPEQEKENVRGAILNPWTVRRLIETSRSELVEKATQSGLTRQQVDQLSKDDAPIDIDNPNETVRRLSDKYDVHFFNLLGWIRQLITGINATGLQSGSTLPAFARKEKRQNNGDSNTGSEH